MLNEPKFKVGDLVKIVNTNGSRSSAGGYDLGRTLKIYRIETMFGVVYFPEHGNGVLESEIDYVKINWRDRLGKS